MVTTAAGGAVGGAVGYKLPGTFVSEEIIPDSAVQK